MFNTEILETSKIQGDEKDVENLMQKHIPIICICSYKHDISQINMISKIKVILMIVSDA